MFGKLEYTIVYIVGILMGVLTFVYPSEPVKSVIGVLFTYWYAALILGGAIGSLVGLLRPNYRVEMFALYLLATGILCYDVALWAIFAQRIQEWGIGTNPAYGPALLVGAFGVLVILKAHYLYRINKQLIKTAIKNGA